MKVIVTAITILFSIFTGSCQEIKQADVPEVVLNSFQTKYPGEDDPDWNIDSHGNYESHFKIKGVKYRADFLPNGTWVETETSIRKKDLPDVIVKRIKKEFPEYKISELEKVDHHAKGIFYDVEFKQKGKNKDVEFSPSGKILN